MLLRKMVLICHFHYRIFHVVLTYALHVGNPTIVFSGTESVQASQIGVINVHDFKYYKSILLVQMLSMLCQVNKIQKMILM